jgi:sialidase-1
MRIPIKKLFFISLWILPALFFLPINCSGDEGGSIVKKEEGKNGSVNEYPGSNGLNYIFSKNLEGYACCRIPALLRIDDKKLLAFAEGRKNGFSDTGNIDLIVKRSEDNGFTWGNNIVVWDDIGNTC